MSKKTKKEKEDKPKKHNNKGKWKGITIKDVLNMSDEQVLEMPSNLRGMAIDLRWRRGISKIQPKKKKEDDDDFNEE